MTQKLQEVLGMSPPYWKKINGSEIMFGEEGHGKWKQSSCLENTCCYLGMSRPWFSRTGKCYAALWARNSLHGHLWYFSTSLNLSLLIWVQCSEHSLASCLNLPSSKCYCRFVSSSHQTINLISASIEEETSWLYQVSYNLTKAILLGSYWFIYFFSNSEHLLKY